MPRPKKAIDYNEEIRRIDMQMLKWKKTIEELQAEKEKLIHQKREAEVGVLYEAMQSNGVSIEAVLALIEHSDPVETAV